MKDILRLNVENSQNFVKWKCYVCGYKWKGKSPYKRYNRPTCRSCGSRSVHVYNWLIDENRWKELRKEIIERDNFRCKRCGLRVELNTARIHHESYDEYYNLDYLTTHCIFCHNYMHEFFLSQVFLWLKNKDLPQSILTVEIIRKHLSLKIFLILLLLVLVILGLIFKG